MLIYEYRIRDEFLRFRKYAANIREKFEREASPDDLLLDVKSLRMHYESLNNMLPKPVQGKSNISSHIGWMEYWLKKGMRNSCVSDINDICKWDIDELEEAFQAWCKSPDHYDAELVLAISDLLAHRQLDSAIRKAFVVLKERLCNHFQMPRDLDGPDLVNKIFGKRSDMVGEMNDAERQAMRDLLVGLYGVYRNRFAHRDEQPSLAEADAIISMINHVLQNIDHIK